MVTVRRKRRTPTRRAKWTDKAKREAAKRDVAAFRRVVKRIERQEERRYRVEIVQVGSAQVYPRPTVEQVLRRIYQPDPPRSLVGSGW